MYQDKYNKGTALEKFLKIFLSSFVFQTGFGTFQFWKMSKILKNAYLIKYEQVFGIIEVPMQFRKLAWKLTITNELKSILYVYDGRTHL